MLSKTDLLSIQSTLEAVEAELEQLVHDNEWYVTDVIDLIVDSKERLAEAITEKQL